MQPAPADEGGEKSGFSPALNVNPSRGDSSPAAVEGATEPRRQRCFWSGVTAAVLALVISGGYKVATAKWGPTSTVISVARGTPHFPGCTTRVKAEGELSGATYRITESKCPRDNIN